MGRQGAQEAGVNSAAKGGSGSEGHFDSQGLGGHHNSKSSGHHTTGALWMFYKDRTMLALAFILNIYTM